MEGKVRGWIGVIGAVLAGYFTYSGSSDYALYIFALLALISGVHHVMGSK